MQRIHQHIPFRPQRRRRNLHAPASSSRESTRPQSRAAAQSHRSTSPPATGPAPSRCAGSPSGSSGCNRNQVVGLQVRLEMDKQLNRRQRERRRCIDHRDARRIPSPAEAPRPQAAEKASAANRSRQIRQIRISYKRRRQCGPARLQPRARRGRYPTGPAAAPAQRAIRRLEPRRRLLSVAQRFSRSGVDLRQPHRPVGLGRRQPRVLLQPPGQRALGNADLFRDFRLAHIQPLGQQKQRLDRQPLAHQLGQGAAFVDRPAQNSLHRQALRVRNGLP